jgi:hypothetical protein
MKIYEIGGNGYWTGNVSSVEDGAGSPAGWTRTAVPSLKKNEFAFWVGSWTIVKEPPAVTQGINIITQPTEVAQYVRVEDLPAILEQYFLDRSKVN